MAASVEPLYLVVSDAHKAVLALERGEVDSQYGRPEPIIDSMVARLTRAKEAIERGDYMTAVREFGPG